MKRQLPFLLLFCIAVTTFQLVNAQVYDLVVLDGESGISGVQINDIAQDANGYIWMATNSGVSRFDGKAFVNYRKRDGLSENVCTTIFCDKDNKIWVGHQTTGLSILYPDSIQHISEGSGLINNEVHDVFQDKEGKIWVATFGGVSSYQSGNWSKHSTENGLVSNNTQAIAQDENGRIWIGSFGSGIDIIDGNGMVHLHIGNGLVNNYVTSLSLKNGHMMIGTLGGMSIWKDGKFKNTSGMNGLSNSQVNEVAVANNGDIWLATYNGLTRVRNANLLRLTEENGLPNNEVLSVFIDVEENVWFGTKKGLVRVRNLAFTHYYSTEDLDIDPSFLYRDSKGGLWAANEAGGVLEFDGERFVSAFDDPDINDHQISSIAEDGNGNIWFGTMDFGGLFQFNGKKLYIFSDEFGLADNNINCLLTDAEGNLIIGTPNGLSIHDGDGFKNVFISDDVASNHVTALVLGPENQVYVGTSDGSVFVLKNGAIDGGIEINSSSPITDLAYGSMGLVAATQSDGVFLLKNGEAVRIEDGGGLTGSSARSLAAIGSQLYVGSANGLRQLSFIQDSILTRSFDRKDGFMGSACKRGVMLADGNTVWIGTTKGIVRYNPTEDDVNTERPRLLFTDLQLFYQQVDWKKLGFELAANGLPIDLELSYTENSLQFFFKGIHHRQPDGVSFSYILEGFEDRWNPATDRQFANYPNLPPGDYTFKLRACNASNICTEEPLEFKVTITPPIWQTAGFYVAWGIIALIITYAYIKIRERRLLEEKRILESTVEERTKELREQKEIVEDQNKHITESIEYAKNIQMAVLPSDHDITAAFDDHFVFYRPKDTVGGDFYWVFSEGNISWAAAVDCTGHGVAGAFMSMIGTDLLNQIIIEKKVNDPALVLEEMDKGIKLAFAQSAKEFESDQGMDVALIRIDKKKKTLEFAGAQRPLYLMYNGELLQIEGNRHSISCAEQRGAEAFLKYTHKIEGESIAYLFSDGIVDQFGGPKGRKFMITRLRGFLEANWSLSMEKQAEKLNTTFDDWKGPEMTQIDDVMLLGIRL